MAGPSSRTVIVRNLKMTNSFALNPVRRCWNMIGPPLSSLTAIAAIYQSGGQTILASLNQRRPESALPLSRKRSDREMRDRRNAGALGIDIDRGLVFAGDLDWPRVR